MWLASLSGRIGGNAQWVGVCPATDLVREENSTSTPDLSATFSETLESLTGDPRRFRLPRGSAAAFRSRLRIAKQMRLSDDPLRVAVVGEFSSGKSTVINTLIGAEVLTADVLPATTACPTLVKFGDQLKAHAYFRDPPRGPYLFQGRTIWERLDGLCDRPDHRASRRELLQAFLRVATVDEKVASLLESVVITVPSRGQGASPEFIDTPGINAEIDRHEDVSTMVVRELCDTAIVTIPAENALSRSLLQFMRQHMLTMLPRCVFVVTRMDLRRPEDRPGIVTNVAARLSGEFGLQNPLILMAPPPTAPPWFAEEETEGAGPTGEAAAFKQQLDEVLTNNRDLLRTARAATRLLEVLTDIRTALRRLGEQQRSPSTAHRDWSIAEVLVALEKTGRLSRQSIHDRVRRQRASLMKEVDAVRSSTRETLRRRVQACESQDAIRALPDWAARSLVSPSLDRLTGKLESAIDATVASAEEWLQSTRGSCLGAVKSLAEGQTIGEPSVRPWPRRTPQSSQMTLSDASVEAELSAAASRTNNASAAGAVVAAGLACILTGGIAAPAVIVGGLLGSAAGKKAFSAPTEELTTRCFHKLWASLDSKLDSFAKQAATSLDELECEAISRVDAVVEAYRDVADTAKKRAERRAQQARENLKRIAQESMLLGQLNERLEDALSGIGLRTDTAQEVGYTDA